MENYFGGGGGDDVGVGGRCVGADIGIGVFVLV